MNSQHEYTIYSKIGPVNRKNRKGLHHHYIQSLREDLDHLILQSGHGNPYHQQGLSSRKFKPENSIHTFHISFT